MAWPRACFAAAAAATICSAAFAAGGHHGVDDASILDAGACEAESWWTRHSGPGRLVHAGLSCRVGPLELGASSEHERDSGSSRSGHGVEAKWAREWAPGFSAGFSLNAGWEAHARPRYQGATLLGLATWTQDAIALHLNLGRDLLRGAPDQARAGVSVDWTPRADWLLSVERYREEQTDFVRAAMRRQVTPAWSLDVSRAQSLRGPNPSNWTLAATFAFNRRQWCSASCAR